ncbi:hypothetical protein AGABI2DRAFT_213191 [Agaricus bisporus var. bisporus H97]|uniref:hypothetical protein n=1 Tax=Agaricus bisporus var. bisporus (strain H97 / ATCC MYA-4626 / FGSC 10389) TaxID=936046 RepID=UPI00029F69DA|nr:hypothetical protein AGABI2DRAFT_213191 [Agaricus bisporus var. bisporus H97]EKV41678.1 hypothetical protein AGABI2DRAFT_213191 [Agaricus bisporus var. bisporus H97]
MVYWLFSVAASLLCFACLATLRNRYRAVYPPGPKPYPFIGNILDMVTSEPWYLYMKWERLYKSKILSLKVPGTRIYILNSFEDAIELLEKRAGVYSDRPRIPLIEMCGWTFNTGLMSNNDRWRKERRVFQQAFKRESVDRYQPTQYDKVHEMLRQLLNDPADFAAHYKTLSAALVLDIMYGYDVQPKNDRIVQVVERAVQTLIENGTDPSVAALNVFPAIRYLPRWFPGTGFHKVVDECTELTKDMLNVPFEHVLKCMREGDTRESLVRSLLEANVIGEDSAKGIAGTALSAGTDTVLSVLECFFFAMALHPEKQHKAQEEIDHIIGLDRLPTFQDRESLVYVEAVYRETLRWLPPFPMTVPHVAEADDFYKGFFIPKGSIIYPNAWAMTHDKERYEDPDSFVPERFLTPDGKLDDNSRIMAFGFGRRLCPGQHLASSTVWLTIATVLATLDLGLPYNLDGDPIKFQQIYTKADSLHLRPYNCRITPRSPAARKLIEGTEYTAGY